MVGSGNNWYYVDTDGKMVTGFQTIAEAKYYFASSGLMQKDGSRSMEQITMQHLVELLKPNG